MFVLLFYIVIVTRYKPNLLSCVQSSLLPRFGCQECSNTRYGVSSVFAKLTLAGQFTNAMLTSTTRT